MLYSFIPHPDNCICCGADLEHPVQFWIGSLPVCRLCAAEYAEELRQREEVAEVVHV